MGVAALVIGIASLLIGFIPLCGFFALVPAIIGIILGIIDVVKKSKSTEEVKPKKGVSIAGIILSSLALILIIIYNVVIVGLLAYANESYNNNTESYNYIDNYDYNSIYDSIYDNYDFDL